MKCDDDRGQISNLKIRSELQLRIVHNKTDYSSQMQVQTTSELRNTAIQHPLQLAEQPVFGRRLSRIGNIHLSPIYDVLDHANHIFSVCEDIILATCQRHHILI